MKRLPPSGPSICLPAALKLEFCAAAAAAAAAAVNAGNPEIIKFHSADVDYTVTLYHCIRS